MNEPELKPCPFCGGKAEFHEGTRGYGKVIYIECADCHAWSGEWYAEYPQRLIEKWNGRKEHTMMYDLKYCPFCGHRNIIFMYERDCPPHTGHGVKARCICGFETMYASSEEEAVKSWNRRVIE